jgi:ABC-type branched-subunit amino acid transport system ATPase component
MSSASAFTGGDPALVADGVVAGYGEEPVVKGVSLGVAAGEIFVIVGPNGAGKSTLLKAMLGLVRVRQGEVRLHGKPITNHRLEDLARQGIGYVPQSDDVFDTLKISENLAMGGVSLSRSLRAERLDAVLEVFPELKSRLDQYAGTLSGGQRKMVAIARMLMPDPVALLLDEPSAGLSPDLSRIVLEEQVGLLAGLGKAILIVEQKAQAALQIAHHAAVLVGGLVAITGSGQQVLHDARVGELFLGSRAAEGTALDFQAETRRR